MEQSKIIDTLETYQYFCSAFLHAISSLMLCTHAELHQSPYFIMHFKFFIRYVKCVYELQDIGGDLQNFTLQCAFAIQRKFLKYAHLQGEFFYILQSNSSISVFTLHMFIPVKNLTYLSQSPKMGRL